MATNPIFSQKLKFIGVVITKENICELISTLSKYYGEHKIKVSFKKGLIIDELSVDTFKNYDFKNEKIETIEVSGRDKNFESSYSIDKNLDDFYEITFSHTEKDKHTLIEKDIGDWIHKMQDKRCLRAFCNRWISSLFFGLIIEIAYLLAVWKADISFNDKMNLSVSLISIPFFIGWFVKLCVKKFFPITEIDIGINNAKKYRGLGWSIISLIIIPLLLSMIL